MTHRPNNVGPAAQQLGATVKRHMVDARSEGCEQEIAIGDSSERTNHAGGNNHDEAERTQRQAEA